MQQKIVPALDRPDLPPDLGAFAGVSAFRDLCARTPILHQIETGFEAVATAPRSLRIGAWNLERCKHLPETVARLKGLDLDIVLLSEMDDGMARSGNLNTTRLLAQGLGLTYAFGVEFIETGHGTDNERALFAGQLNHKALHGNAILSRFALSGLRLLRLPGGEVWTEMDWHDARLGARMALAGVVQTSAGPLAVVSTHFESLPGPAERGDHMRHIVDFVDAAFSGLPVVVGGDLNSADLPEAHDQDDTTPPWFLHPETYEPLFGVVRQAGYGWLDANTAQHTRRQVASGRPFRPFKKVDWLFTRGLAVEGAAVLPAVDASGAPVSDHELVVATVTLPARR